MVFNRMSRGCIKFINSDAFISDESQNNEFYILKNGCNGCWIIQDMNGNIRVWDNTMEELFFGNNYIYERKNDESNCDYIPVMV